MQHPVSEHLKTLRGLVEDTKAKRGSVTDELSRYAHDNLVKNEELANAQYEHAMRLEEELREEQKRLNGIFSSRPAPLQFPKK
jgi:hypothetical protein